MALLKTFGAVTLVAAVIVAAGPAAAQAPGGGGQAGAPAEAPPEFTIDTAGWTGGAQIQEGRFLNCSVSRRYDNGLTLIVGMNGRYDINLGLLNPQWTLAEGAETRARVQVDGAFDKTYPAVPAGPQVMVTAVGQDEALFERLRRGSRLTVTIDQDSHQFALTGTAASLGAVRACVDRARQLAGQPPGGAGQQRGTLTAQQMAGLLRQAGIENVRFAVPADLPPGVAQLWMLEDPEVQGGVHQRPREDEQIRIDDFAEAFIEVVAESCPVDMAREEQPTQTIGGRYALKSVLLRCPGGEQPAAMSVLFALDDINYSAFFHQAPIAKEAAAAEATAGLEKVIRNLAETAVDKDDEPAPPAQ